MLLTGWSEAHVAASVACLHSVLPLGVGVAVTTPMPCYRTFNIIVCAGVCAPCALMVICRRVFHSWVNKMQGGSLLRLASQWK